MADKSVTFRVSDETHQRLVRNFGIPGSRGNMEQLIDAYEQRIENDGLRAEKEALQERVDYLNSIVDKERTERADIAERLSAREDEVANLKEELLTKQEEMEAEGGVEQLREALYTARDTIATLNEQNEHMAARLREAETEKQTWMANPPSWEKVKQTMQPFAAALIGETARLLSEKYGREITPMAILVDMFLRYTIERNAEWFYPFVLRDKDIVRIANEENENIVSMEQIRKAVLRR